MDVPRETGGEREHGSAGLSARDAAGHLANLAGQFGGVPNVTTWMTGRDAWPKLFVRRLTAPVRTVAVLCLHRAGNAVYTWSDGAALASVGAVERAASVVLEDLYPGGLAPGRPVGGDRWW